MKRLILAEGQVLDFDIMTERVLSDHFDTNIIIYFVLDGETEIVIDDESTVLKSKDFMLINAYQHHSYHAVMQALVVRFVVNASEISKFYDIHNIEFRCNSTSREMEQYTAFRKLLEACVSNYYGKETRDGKSLIRLNSIYYQVLESLVSNFAQYVTSDSSSVEPNEERINAIISYINTNYKRQISLTELSEKMFLSTAYISRYFKKKIGKNLGEYLTEIRLDYAIRELENTEKSIARIALDNGFPNIAAFNKAFREHYNTKPKTYQEEFLAQKKDNEQSTKLTGDMEYRLLDYLDHKDDLVPETEDFHITLSTDARSYRYLSKTWSRLINIGRVVTLLRSDIQEHVLFLKDKLKIEYVRLWDLYDEELQMNVTNTEGRHNFTKLDKVVDFLVEHQLKPYFELGFKPIILRDSYNTYLSYREREILFKTMPDYRRFLETLVIHLVNRYGLYEISQWYFEQWCDPRLFSDGVSDRYFDTFETAYTTIKSVAPEAKVGGAYDRSFKIIDYSRLIAEWGMRNLQPDFVSVYCYRTRAKDSLQDKDSEMVAQSADFLKNYLLSCKNVMRNYGMNVPVHISEWNFTVVNSNVLNDSCFKGAYVMKNLMELYAEAEMIGYWFGTDLFVEYEEAPKLLDGYCGLVSYQGICKPAYYAMEFMNRMGSFLLGQTNNVMVTTDGYDNYMIVCHNYKHVGIQYFMQDEKTIKIEKIPLFFDDVAKLRINIQIDNVRDGFYYVKTRSISQKNGSIQDEWLRLGLIENLNTADIDYLRQISTPRITIYEHTVSRQMLEVSILLDPNEIQCVHIYRQIKA